MYVFCNYLSQLVAFFGLLVELHLPLQLIIFGSSSPGLLLQLRMLLLDMLPCLCITCEYVACLCQDEAWRQDTVPGEALHLTSQVCELSLEAILA